MKTITVTYSLSKVCSDSIEVPDDFVLENLDSFDSWDEICESYPELDMDLASDSDDSNMDLDITSMDITDKDGKCVFKTHFYDK